MLNLEMQILFRCMTYIYMQRRSHGVHPQTKIPDYAYVRTSMHEILHNQRELAETVETYQLRLPVE
jgi:hypothetical protein